MDRTIIDRLRNLRKKAEKISRKLVEDLKPFLHEKDEITFRRLPDSESQKGDVGVTTTCSCLMALSMTHKLKDFYNPKPTNTAKKAFESVVSANWESSGLVESNAFTSTIVLRAFSFLQASGQFSENDLDNLKHKGKKQKKERSLREVARLRVVGMPKRFRVGKYRVGKYPATPAIVYWFVDAISRAKVTLNENSWEKIFSWASGEFTRQQSLVYSEHEALMDPVAMAMAACLSRKLRHLGENNRLGASLRLTQNLPSNVELRHSILILFEKQSRCGIWSKYFPLFHYPDAGSNYCFTFEMLEAVLNEFENVVIGEDNEELFKGLEKAVNWCQSNRLEYFDDTSKKKYYGWNSGGQIQTLKKGMPESWATGVIHMFLQKLQNILTNKIQESILEQYNARRYDEEESKWERLIEINIKLKQTDKQYPTLKDLLEKRIINTVESKTHTDMRQSPLRFDRSVLLFGPPGTSKTVLVRELAKKVKWPLIEIDPSSFLREDLINIYSQANKIFNDLMDLAGVVILFDEMDSIVLTREKDKAALLDATSRFLTTCMLPKLARLHDLGQVVFFMATNHQDMLDPAIKRSGRFDLRLFVGPPTWKSKLDRLEEFFDRDHPKKDIENAKKLLKEWTIGDEIEKKLDHFTYGELKAFFSNFRGHDMLFDALTSKDKDVFIKRVEMWYNTIALADKDTREQYEKDKDSSVLQ